MTPDADGLLETIGTLAMQLAQSCPDCADKAQRIVSLVGELRGLPVDRSTVKDAIETATVDRDLSDAELGATVEAVMKVGRGTEH